MANTQKYKKKQRGGNGGNTHPTAGVKTMVSALGDRLKSFKKTVNRTLKHMKNMQRLNAHTKRLNNKYKKIKSKSTGRSMFSRKSKTSSLTKGTILNP